MLRLFNKYLSRLRTDHEVFGNKELFVTILLFLGGDDLFECSQVSFYWRSTILGTPTLEIKMLRFTIQKSNECVAGRSSRNEQPLPVVLPLQYPLQSPRPAFPRVTRSVQKWERFKSYFYSYAKQRGFEVRTRSSFASAADWEQYEREFYQFYDSYVQHIKETRKPTVRQPPPRQSLVEKCKNLKNDIGQRIHSYATRRVVITNKMPSDVQAAELYV